MTNKIEIFDPALCCPTGVCGPSVDPELTRVASTIFTLENKGFYIKRFNLGTEPRMFVENKVINTLLHEKGPDALPITLLNGEAVKIGEYPSNEEFAEWLHVNEQDLQEPASKTRLL
ncbi:arsenite efflux transporter metallochaperone ArsD [Bacillus salitolerans]|uniref:Arsenite efflux transporter metallochaperone ArsD n=1 Tax=Bacillus salitolerans TaxID=1437434 RepID=A0ABW4LRF8_9BACI